MNNKELQWFNIIKNDRDLIEDSQIFNLDRPFENEQLNDLLYYFRKKLNDSNKYKRPHGALKEAYKDLSTHYPENDLKRHIDASGGIKKHVKDIEEELIGRYQLRTVQNKCEEHINCMNTDIHPQEVLDDIKSMVDKLEDSVTEGESMSKNEAVGMIYEKWKKLAEGDYSDFVKTGIKELDDKIIGLQRQQNVVLGARPSMGKTAGALTFMANIAPFYKCAMVSVETGKQGLIERLAYIMSGVSGNKFTLGEDITQEDINKVNLALKEICNNDNYIIESTSNRSIRNVARIIRKIKRDNPDLRVVFVDYVQKIESTKQSLPKHIQIDEVSGILTDLGKKLDVTMVNLAQLNRDTEKDGRETEPKLHHFDGSSSIEKDADIAILIHRSRQGAKEASEEGSTTKPLFKAHVGDVQTPDKLHTAFIVAKNRDGQTGWAKARYNSPCTRFEDFDIYDKDSYQQF